MLDQFHKIAAAGIASAMMTLQMEVPAFAARATPTFERSPEYDGLGRKKRVVTHPNHSRKRRSKAWRDYAAKVRATHRVNASGRRQTDPRDDKYLHSYARGWRGLAAGLRAS